MGIFKDKLNIFGIGLKHLKYTGICKGQTKSRLRVASTIWQIAQGNRPDWRHVSTGRSVAMPRKWRRL